MLCSIPYSSARPELVRQPGFRSPFHQSQNPFPKMHATACSAQAASQPSASPSGTGPVCRRPARVAPRRGALPGVFPRSTPPPSPGFPRLAPSLFSHARQNQPAPSVPTRSAPVWTHESAITAANGRVPLTACPVPSRMSIRAGTTRDPIRPTCQGNDDPPLPPHLLGRHDASYA